MKGLTMKLRKMSASAREMRYKAEFELNNGEYRYADGIVLASGDVVSY